MNFIYLLHFKLCHNFNFFTHKATADRKIFTSVSVKKISCSPKSEKSSSKECIRYNKHKYLSFLEEDGFIRFFNKIYQKDQADNFVTFALIPLIVTIE